ncbi:sigma factor-like helix-turn-helix DNA-binding protein [Iamia majanohamensis]|uniref:Sigma factor-like helix-turn-helix DNA-binding protein n=1 Tax=Iamia majanohamensis TaxID=467976 RepID=A0AAE9Y945_9ACTN|nr:sigma factor-like helix-turn-helix DNA-binding protein [Iamia majanohamensis]WCO69229.1 sigma factor-like helix-turn-helix DNA-binding protein [Iamia majanohamensis]
MRTGGGPGLTALQRQAIDLAFFEGHTYPQAASSLGVPVATLKTRARDALVALRCALTTPGESLA